MSIGLKSLARLSSLSLIRMHLIWHLQAITHAGQLARSKRQTLVANPWNVFATLFAWRLSHRNNGRLLVGGGLGCSNLPLRINADPEIPICELHFAESWDRSGTEASH